MTNYYINLDLQGEGDSQEKILNTLSHVDVEDELVITLEANNHKKAELVRELLEDNGFEYLPKGSDDGTTFSMIAHLKQD